MELGWLIVKGGRKNMHNQERKKYSTGSRKLKNRPQLASHENRPKVSSDLAKKEKSKQARKGIKIQLLLF